MDYAAIAKRCFAIVDEADVSPGDPADDLTVLLATLAGSEEVDPEEIPVARQQIIDWLESEEAV